MENDHSTIFSSAEFVRCWCSAIGDCEPVALQVLGSGPPRTMYMIRTPLTFARYQVSGPRAHDLWTSPGWIGELKAGEMIADMLRQIKGLRVESVDVAGTFRS